MESIVEKLRKPVYRTHLQLAYDHIEDLHGKTPLLPFTTKDYGDFRVGLFAKMDTLNPGGSFKDRGAEYYIERAFDNRRLKAGDTVVTASAGNHAKGVAKSAQLHGLKAIIFMSDKTPKSKIEGAKNLGADVRLVAGDYHKAAEEATAFAYTNRYEYVPAYQHEDIIIGQSTVATEAMIQLFNLFKKRPDFFVSPFGGGGLANGIGCALRYYDEQGLFSIDGSGKKIFNFGVQSENFDTMFRSFKSEPRRVQSYIPKGDTIADGIRVAKADEQMLELSEMFVDDIFTVSELDIRAAIRSVYYSDFIKEIQRSQELREKFGFTTNHINGVSRLNIVEGAAAAAFACILNQYKVPYEKILKECGKRTPRDGKLELTGVVIASGNNIDRKLLEEILTE